MSDAPCLFVVARVSWSVRRWHDQTEFRVDDRDNPTDRRRFVPVEAFAKRDAAEARA